MEIKYRILIFCLVLYLTGFSQNERPVNWCSSTYPAEMIPFLERASQDIQNNTYRAGEDYTLPVLVHIIRETDGSGGISEASVLDVFCEVRETYTDYGINLYLRDFRYINNSNFYTNSGLYSTIDLLYSEPNVINIYIHSAAANLCGVYIGSATDQQTIDEPDIIQVTLSSDCWNPRVVTHEIGHYFGLPHTFLGFEGTGLNCGVQVSSGEKVDGSNCTTAGDRICDTPPDYSAVPEWACDIDGEGCLQIDPDGVEFNPDGTNYMSYSSSDCANGFTPMQSDVIKSVIDNLRQDLYVLPLPNNLSLTIGTSSLSLPPNSAIVPYDEVYFNWTPASGASAYLLEINRVPSFSPNFVVETVIGTSNDYTSYALAPSQTYYWRVKPYNPVSTCSPFSDTGMFTTAAWTVATEEVEGIESFEVFPNCISSGQTVNVGIASDRNMNGTLELYNTKGQRIYATAIDVSAATNHFVIPSDKLTAGMYIINVDFENGRMQKKLVVGK